MFKLFYILFYISSFFVLIVISTSIEIPDAKAEFGLWGEWTYCDKGKYLQGIFTTNKFDSLNSDGEFKVSGYFCQEPGILQSHEKYEVEKNENVAMCEGFIVGFQLKLQNIEKIGQRSLIEKLKVFCTKGTIMLGPQNEKENGTWTEAKLCKSNEAVCGMRIMEYNPLNLDDLSRIHYSDWFKCCHIIDKKFEHCHPEDKWEVVFEVDNTRGIEPLKYTYTKIIGVEIENVKYEKKDESEKNAFSGHLITKYKKDLLGAHPITYVISPHEAPNTNIPIIHPLHSKLNGNKRESQRPEFYPLKRRRAKVFVAISLLNVNITDGEKNSNDNYMYNNYNDKNLNQNIFNNHYLKGENISKMENFVREILNKRLESSNSDLEKSQQSTFQNRNYFNELQEKEKELEELALLFKKELQSKGMTGFNWAKSSSETWQPSKKTTIVIDVLPGNLITMYQVLGTCGNFKIRAEKFYQNGTFNEAIRPNYEKQQIKDPDGKFTKMGNIINSMSFMFQDILNAARKITTTFHYPEESNMNFNF